MIIGITGLAGSGKDTVGRVLVHDFGYTRLSCATKVKDVAATLFGWDRIKLEGLEEEDRKWREEFIDPIHKITPRQGLIKIGQGLKDVIDPCIWSNIVHQNIIEQSLKDVVITDVRFPSEIDLVRKLNGIIIRVTRGELPKWFNCIERCAIDVCKDPRDINAINFYKDYRESLIKYGISPSELDWIGFDKPEIVLKNNKGLEEFKLLALDTISRFLEMADD